MIPRQWLVSCHRKRASAEAHQSVSNPRAMPPHAAMAAATLGLAASAALDPRPPWSGTIRQATDLCRRTLEGVPHTWRRALEACTKGCTTRDGLKRQAAGASWSLRRRGPLSSRPAPATCPRHLLRSCRLLLESVSLVEPTAEPRVQ